jgi:hypothetical protein
MFCLFSTVVMPVRTTGLPPDQAFQYGLQMGRNASPAQQLFAVALYCVPPLLLVVVGVTSFLVVRSYQKRSGTDVTPPQPPSL